MTEPIPLRAEPELARNDEKKPWHRLENEPADYYQRFRNFALMGRKRSLLAVYQMEATTEQALESAGEPQQKEIRNVPGSWKKASVRWRWVERAQAWDVARREEHQAQRLNAVYDEAVYASRAQRVVTLSAMAKGIYDYLSEKTVISPVRLDQKDRVTSYLTCIKTLQSILRDIRKEMDELNKAW